ncbi:hypothetical protein A3B32_00430 [Candidatus Uhrbacteria bacterium RIFCSPLOWO2_01_FULL_53_9]|uniref:Single-stranded DNA-binding protein n=3 Tax=Candidatus Uhriibacteriota TaxID=1752732 RepID=A0A1F7UZT2_9BACT|nr:MAG: hypothetical protein A3C17_00060 [Candidatus Uhrbacteria bacterium RIFCSPHIGHO2_02_FULL_53_13]OGL83244.1 MAG: hypothetical protein A3B32_00430 [Candidatus Uhrbacteria bacterium RIFCSPLOWO2_01_FULL_53_9]OGL89441.1 MAG: hypothetical protein A3I45_01875 [Candidatus Uhrbacteria bacterium RIFCSPLOWO2_02_FULL_53_10]
MMSLNRAQVIGNLTRDPELRTTATGQSVVNMGVATNRRYTDKNGQQVDQSEFHNVVAWGKLADIASQYLAKGRRVYVEGRLQTREWEGQDGSKRRTTEIVAENLIMLDRAPGGAGTSGSRTPFDVAQLEPIEAAPMPAHEDEIQVEDIPF